MRAPSALWREFVLPFHHALWAAWLQLPAMHPSLLDLLTPPPPILLLLLLLLLSFCPRLNPENRHFVARNSAFELMLSLLYKFREWDFANAASADVNPNLSTGEEDANRPRFRDAIDSFRRGAWTRGGGECCRGGGR
jgi:hypothetical protein